MSLKFLRPKLLNVITTIVVLTLPLLKERVQLPEGGFVVERYTPIVLIGSYVWLRDPYPLLLMIGFSLVVYIVVSVALATLSKLFRNSLSKRLGFKRK